MSARNNAAEQAPDPVAAKVTAKSPAHRLLGVPDDVGPAPTAKRTRRRHRRPEPKPTLEAMAVLEPADPLDPAGWDPDLEEIGAAWAAEFAERNGQAS